MSQLGEQIAVLDGLAALDPNDGRIGQQRARVDQYARALMPGVLTRTGVIDPSGGANRSGGSDWAPGMPLMPSTVGLANIPSVLPSKRGVVAPSGGANYTGGSDWVPGLPLVVSSAGLADSLIRGGYGRGGLGTALVRGGYGRAGLGVTNSAIDEDLAGAAEAVELGRVMDANDGRIGQERARVDEYGRPVMPGVLERSNVIDASAGANYAGGSSYAPGLPLMPSSVGLAGLGEYDELDGLSDLAIGLPKALVKMAGKRALDKAKDGAARLMRTARRRRTPQQRAAFMAKLQAKGLTIEKMREIRRAALARKQQQQRMMAQHGGVGPNFAIRAPLWAR